MLQRVEIAAGAVSTIHPNEVIVRTSGRISLVLAAMVLAGLAPPGSPPPAAAQLLQVPVLQVAVSPTSGPAGGSFALNWTVNSATGCEKVTFSWQPGPLPTATPPPPPRRGSVSGSVTATVPFGTAEGTYPIDAWCSNGKALTRFTVKGSLPTTTTQPPITQPPVTTITPLPTRPPTVTATVPSRTTPRPTASLPTTTPSTEPSVPSSSEPITDEPEPAGDLRFDRTSLYPGDTASATGQGCVPGSPVRLSSGAEQVGSAVADNAGEFTARVEFTRVEPGRHLIAAECGVLLTGSVDQLVTSSTGGSSTALVVLVFFVAAAAAMIRFS